jgi:hypothetical protein
MELSQRREGVVHLRPPPDNMRWRGANKGSVRREGLEPLTLGLEVCRAGRDPNSRPSERRARSGSELWLSLAKGVLVVCRLAGRFACFRSSRRPRDDLGSWG